MQDTEAMCPSCNQLTACHLNHCYQSITHQPQPFSPQDGPFKCDLLLTHTSPLNAAHTAAAGKLTTTTRASTFFGLQSGLNVHCLYQNHYLDQAPSRLLLWLGMLLGQFREHLKSRAISTKHNCISICCSKWFNLQ